MAQGVALNYFSTKIWLICKLKRNGKATIRVIKSAFVGVENCRQQQEIRIAIPYLSRYTLQCILNSIYESALKKSQTVRSGDRPYFINFGRKCKQS